MSYQKKGGEARAASLTAEQRKEIATKAASSRWGSEGVKRAIAGNSEKLLKIGDAQIECYVLEDGTRVLSGRGMQQAIGFGGEAKSHGSKLKEFLSLNTIKPFVNNELAMAINNPVRFIRPSRGGVPAIAFEATLLIDLCEAIINAKDSKGFRESWLPLVKQAQIITLSFAKVGIVAAVDEVTGYQEVRAKDALQKLLDRYINKELSAWVKRFPDEFYEQMYRLKGWEWSGMSKNRFSCVGNYTKDVVYERLAPELIEEMQRINPKDDLGNRKGRHHQLLTQDVGLPALSQHFHLVLTLMRASSNWEEFKLSLDRFVPKKNDNFLLDV